MSMEHGSRSFLSPWDKVAVGWHLDFSLTHPGQRNRKNCKMNNCVFKKLSCSNLIYLYKIRSDQSLSRVWLCDPMNRSTRDLPVHHQLPEFTQTHVHQSLMPSNHLILCRSLLLLPPIPPSIRVFSNESALAWGGQSIGVSASALVLPMNTQDWSPLGWTGWISLQCKGLSRVLSNHSSEASILQRSAFL